MKSEITTVPTLEPEIIECLRRALEEDIGSGDVTTDSIVPVGATLRGTIVAKEAGVIAGLDIAQNVFLMVDREIDFNANVGEGDRVVSGAVLADISGSARALLSGERTALNFLGRMSGIATLTRQFVEACRNKRKDSRYTEDCARAQNFR